jgi:hypothetical protein
MISRRSVWLPVFSPPWGGPLPRETRYPVRSVTVVNPFAAGGQSEPSAAS